MCNSIYCESYQVFSQGLLRAALYIMKIEVVMLACNSANCRKMSVCFLFLHAFQFPIGREGFPKWRNLQRGGRHLQSAGAESYPPCSASSIECLPTRHRKAEAVGLFQEHNADWNSLLVRQQMLQQESDLIIPVGRNILSYKKKMQIQSRNRIIIKATTNETALAV